MTASFGARPLDALREFYDANVEQVATRAADADDRTLALFRSAAAEVPAYASFLAEHRVDPARIRTIADFLAVPPTTKENYHKKHPLASLCRGGVLSACDMLAVSSGTTGEPTVWPRFVNDEVASAERFEHVLADGFAGKSRTTLAVICFALGSWVGGMYTTACCRHLAAKGYPLTVVSPGNQKLEILRVVRAVGSLYDQVVLFGYPPFLKDVIDAGRADGLDWSKYRVRLVMAGEVFSEEWRTLVCERAGSRDPEHDTASVYGTADGGVLANETPASIEIRRFFANRPDAMRELFGESRLPTLCQYDPYRRYFEDDSGSLLFSSDGTVPLVRYRILDRGGVVSFETMRSRLAELGHRPKDALSTRALPFVFVFGRSSSAVSFYGANVYAENVAPGLERLELAEHVTGKFVMQVGRDADQNATLEIKIELATNTASSDALRATLSRSIRDEIEHQNSEFRNYAPDERRMPKVELLPHGNAEWFPIGVKHRYTR